MRKLSLQLHDLKVDSFVVEPNGNSPRGTVHGNQPIQTFQSGCFTYLCLNTDTCVIWCQQGTFVSCVTCDNTCGDSCGGTCGVSCAPLPEQCV